LIHPSLAPILQPTHGELLFADQVVQILRLFDFTHAWADRYRRALVTGRRAERYAMERELKDAARLRRWADEQLNGVQALLQEHAGYLYAHGHALALAQHVFHQACLKLDPATAPTFFAEVLNNDATTAERAHSRRSLSTLRGQVTSAGLTQLMPKPAMAPP
jgi:DNA polymerase-3 subunit alpha